MKLTHTFEISEAAFNLLKEIDKIGYAEYRDTEFETLEEYIHSKNWDGNHPPTKIQIENFKSRNFGGTYYLTTELCKFNLVELDDMSWHTTFVVTEIGKQVIQQNS